MKEPLKNVHKVIKFNQKAWFKRYIYLYENNAKNESKK